MNSGPAGSMTDLVTEKGGKNENSMVDLFGFFGRNG
jgi:hypothetical protein